MKLLSYIARGALLLGAVLVTSHASAQSANEANLQRIQLSTGEIMSVNIVAETPEMIRFIHPLLGEITLDRANVTILPPDEPAPAQDEQADAETAAQTDEAAAEESGDAATPAAETEPATQPEIPAVPPQEWKFKLVLGGAFSDGNTDNANFTGMFNALRESEKNRTLFDVGYYYTESDHETSENRFTAGVRHDWLNPGSKWFYFGDARYDYDEFQSWDNRVQAHLGIGYRLIEPPKWKINLLAGAGALKEFGSDDDEVRPEALFGLEGEWQIAEKNTFVFASTIYPDLSDLGEYRWVSSGAWSYLLDEKNKLSLTAGVQYEYDSVVDPGSEHHDLRAYMGLQLDF